MSLVVRLCEQSERLGVAPGGRGAWTVAIGNDGPAAVTCRLTVTGEAASWFWFAQPTLTAAAGETTEVRIGVRVPSSPAPAPGERPFSVEVRTDGGSDPVTCAGAIEVLATGDVAAS